MVAEEVAALSEGHWMRESLTHRAQLHAWGGDQVVNDAEQEFGLNEHIARDQKVGMLGDGSSKRILDGDNGRGNRPALDVIEHFGRAGTRENSAARQHAFSSFVAEGTKLTLDGNLEGSGRFRHKAR
jgi:hypothetical protein